MGELRRLPHHGQGRGRFVVQHEAMRRRGHSRHGTFHVGLLRGVDGEHGGGERRALVVHGEYEEVVHVTRLEVAYCGHCVCQVQCLQGR